MHLEQLVRLAATFVVSVGLGLYLTPIIRAGALRFNVLDTPDGKLKRQTGAVPYLGGIAVYLAFLVTLALVFEFDGRLLGLLLGGTMMAMLGLFDDMKVLPPVLKLLGQVLGALVLIKSGIAIQLEILPVWVALPLSVAWLVGITNAVNLVDVSDGLAAGVSTIAALTLAVIAFLNRDLLIATTSLALAGSLAAFLTFNRPPARIYLGDAGSLFIGFMLAALSMIGAYTRHNTVAAVAPLGILAFPIFETVLLSIARLLRGVAPWRGSGDHLALRLRAKGWTAGGVATLGIGASLVGGGAAIAMVLATAPVAIVIAASIIALALVALVLVLWRHPAPY